MGFECLASVIGIGSKRLRKALAGTPDMRYHQFGGGVRLTPKTNHVDKFLFQLHGTVAETLPTGWPVGKLQERFPCFLDPSSPN